MTSRTILFDESREILFLSFFFVLAVGELKEEVPRKQQRGCRDDECQSLAMVVHMTAAPYGCGRDLYIFMRPEMVKGKVRKAMIWVTQLDANPGDRSAVSADDCERVSRGAWSTCRTNGAV